MRTLYSLLVTLGTPLVLLYFFLRGLRDHAYLLRWGERFGFVQPGPKAGGILLHAASVGEFNAANPLAEALLDRYPGLPLTITTLTPTGSDRVLQVFSGRVFHYHLPLDLPFAVARFLDRVEPLLIIVMETEIWPNLYHQAHRRKIPLIIANARMSAKSVKGYQRWPGLVAAALQPVTWVGAQSSRDLEHMVQCGVVAQNIETTGNLKFDLQIPDSLLEQGETLRRQWGPARPVLIAGSTHEADENVLFRAFTALLKNIPNALLVLVPRHPERFARAAQAAMGAGLRVERYSDNADCPEQTQCFVMDTMGQLMACYAAGDATFVGGSMGEQGGHNVLEPAALGKPVLVGPNTANASDIVTELVNGGAAWRVCDWQQLQRSAETLLKDSSVRQQMGLAGLALMENNQGALGRTLAAIEPLLSSIEAQDPT